MRKTFSEKINSATCIKAQNLTKSGIFRLFRKSGSGRCSNMYKTSKNQRKYKILIFFEKLNLDLSFGEGFDGIRQLARFLQHFEVG